MTLSRTQEVPLVGDRVLYRKAFGHGTQVEATVTGLGDEAGTPVVDVVLDNGARHWGYLDQIEHPEAPLVHRDGLVAAYARRFVNDPKLAVGVVTGADYWPPEGVRDGDNPHYCLATRLDELAGEAADQHYDLMQARKLGIGVSQIKLDQLEAAEEAFLILAARHNDNGQAWEDAYEDRPIYGGGTSAGRTL